MNSCTIFTRPEACISDAILEQYKTAQDFISLSVNSFNDDNVEKALFESKLGLISFPDNFVLLKNTASFSARLNQFVEAKKYCLLALEIAPKDLGSLYILLRVSIELTDFSDAATFINEHLSPVMKPNWMRPVPLQSNIPKNFTNSSLKQKGYELPGEVTTLVHFANTLTDLGFLNESYFVFQNLFNSHDQLNIHFDYGLLLLSMGEYKKGWKEYGHRLHELPHVKRLALNFKVPIYQGGNLEGKTILAYADQGGGDILQFSRYLELLKSTKKADQLIVSGPSCFRSLIGNLTCVDFYFENSRAPEQKYHCWIFFSALPECFDTQLVTIPVKQPYLFSNPKELENVIKLPIETFKIGVSWKGASPQCALSSLSLLKPLWNLARNKSLNISFISLQKDDKTNELNTYAEFQSMLDVTGYFIDYNHTAAIVEQLDLVISVDTSVAHLAGALNVPCWVLLPYHKRCWRWSDAEESSAWYPSNMRLFGQRLDEKTWVPVIARLTESLKEKLQPEYTPEI